jgi:hypothetical protein
VRLQFLDVRSGPLAASNLLCLLGQLGAPSMLRARSNTWHAVRNPVRIFSRPERDLGFNRARRTRDLSGQADGSFWFSTSTKRACRVISFLDPSSKTRTRWRVPPDPRTTPCRPAILGPAAEVTMIRCPFTSSFLTSVRSSRFGRLRLFDGSTVET